MNCSRLIMTLSLSIALATAAQASQRGYDQHDTEYWSTSAKVSEVDVTAFLDNYSLTAEDIVGGKTAFDRMNSISQKNDSGSH